MTARDDEAHALGQGEKMKDGRELGAKEWARIWRKARDFHDANIPPCCKRFIRKEVAAALRDGRKGINP